MAIPDYQSIMLPLLRLAGDAEEHSTRGAIDYLGDSFGLTDEERRELLPSGQQTIFDNRVGWARTYLSKARLLEPTKRGHFRITDRGKEVLHRGVERIDVRFLEQFPEFLEFRRRKRLKREAQEVPHRTSVTPEEEIEEAHQRAREALASELLEAVKGCSPSFFERLVVDLLVRMGYGGSRQDAGRAIGRSGDGGIDGIIKEDKLGLDVLYLQAKRWEAVVGRPEIQKFVGALQGQKARKGIFITTSNFSKDALDYAAHIDTRVILIDGEQLAEFMIDFGIGVASVATYHLKRLDSDYFPDT